MTASVAGGRAVSLCQTKDPSSPSTRLTTASASSSQLEPGKRSTAIRIWPRLFHDLEAVVLDDGVGEELLAHGIHPPARFFAPARVDSHLNEASHADLVCIGEAEP